MTPKYRHDSSDRQIAIAMREKTRRTCPLCSVCSGELQITYDLNHEGVPELFRVSCADCGYTVGYYDDIQSAVAAATTVSREETEATDDLIRRQMQEALGRTILAYERLIANPAENISNWASFGKFAACRFCRIAEIVRKPLEDLPCRKTNCPLSKAEEGYSSVPCWGLTAMRLQDAIAKTDAGLAAKLAQLRLEEIKASAEKMGYTVTRWSKPATRISHGSAQIADMCTGQATKTVQSHRKP